MKDTWARKEVAEITGIPDRRILFYSEQNILPGFFSAVGRGAAREYTLKDIFFLLIVKELNSLGLSLSRIRTIILGLFAHTLTFPDGTGPAKHLKPIWINGTLTEVPTSLIIALPQGPEEHALSPDSKGYDGEVFFNVFPTSDGIITDRPSQIILNLNQIFDKGKL